MAANHPATGQAVERAPEVSVIVPARNEEASLAACLESLVTQTGVSFEVIAVDDHSSDRTREIAASFAGVRVVDAGTLAEGWTGKNNAVTAAARVARGKWLLFTDADTVHLPASLVRAVAEAQEHGAELLSYSPEQIVVGFWEMATLPVVFAALAREYPPKEVSDPASPIAAANGQYILIRRAAYDAVGGHAAIAEEILEDVALARAVKRSGRKIRFRYADDAVRTRMYRSFRQLREGWTKNLALLFPNPGWGAAKTLFWWAIPWLILLLTKWSLTWRVVAAMVVLARNTAQLRRANFGLGMDILGALAGMPMFAFLLLRSRRAHRQNKVGWKGRTYANKNGLLAADH